MELLSHAKARKARLVVDEFTIEPSFHQGSGAPSLVQFQQIVGGTDQGPLALHVLDASEQEGPKASRLLDLPEGRLHDGLPSPVDG